MTTEVIINNTPYWLGFFSSLISSLAWPFAIISIVFILRNSIENLISKITNLNKLTAKGFSLEFSDQLHEVKESVDSEINTDIGGDADADADSDAKNIMNPQLEYIYDLALKSPRAAITESWKWLENILYSNYPKTPPYQSLKNLLNENIISVEMFNNMNLLRKLRNIAVHKSDDDLTINDALNYLYTVDKLIHYFNTIGYTKN